MGRRYDRPAAHRRESMALVIVLIAVALAVGLTIGSFVADALAMVGDTLDTARVGR